jgi:hypothetical protein
MSSSPSLRENLVAKLPKSSPIPKKNRAYNKLEHFEFSANEREKGFEDPTVDLEDIQIDDEEQSQQQLEANAPKDTVRFCKFYRRFRTKRYKII